MAQKNNLTIQVVSIIGGILTAIFFLGFLVVASIIRTETSSLIIGCLFIITTLTISRRLTVPFLDAMNITPVSYTHLRAHETGRNLVCRLLLEKKKTKT